MLLFDGTLFADYHQIYLADSAGTPDFPTDWTPQALDARLLAGERVIVVSTARNMDVPVTVELHESRPDIGLETADHAVIGSFRTSGEIVIAGLTDYWPDAARARVPAGTLCLMAISSGLATLSENGLDGEDRYGLHLWPCEATGTTVLRRWTGGNRQASPEPPQALSDPRTRSGCARRSPVPPASCGRRGQAGR